MLIQYIKNGAKDHHYSMAILDNRWAKNNIKVTRITKDGAKDGPCSTTKSDASLACAHHSRGNINNITNEVVDNKAIYNYTINFE